MAKPYLDENESTDAQMMMNDELRITLFEQQTIHIVDGCTKRRVSSVDSIDRAVVERAKLENYEEIIESGLTSFIEVGNALAEIREGKLYKATHTNFGDYCKGRWGFTQQHATRLCRSAEVATRLSESEPVGSCFSERHARPLTQLEPSEQVAAWQEAVELAGGAVTAKHVEQVVNRRLGATAPVIHAEPDK